MTKSKKPKVSVTGGAGAGYALPTTVGIVNHDPTRPRAPGYSFGTRPQDRDKYRAPGPHYNVDTGLTPRGPGHSPSYSITGRPKRTVWDSMISRSPGPSSYTVPVTSSIPGEKAPPSYSFGFPHRHRRRDQLPAPNAYTIPGTLGSHAAHLRSGPAPTLHPKAAGAKGFSYDYAKTPGPAKYDPVDLSHTLKRAPAATLKGRTKLPPLGTATTPGPAAYDPGNLEKVSKNSPRLVLKARYNDDMRPPLFMLH